MGDAFGSQQPSDRRRERRERGSAAARVLRDSDKMRLGVDAGLKDISAIGLGLTMADALELGEHVKVHLTNEIQKVQKETRGIVRHVTPQDDGLFHVGIELFARLTPLEVMLLRMGMRDSWKDEGQTWV